MGDKNYWFFHLSTIQRRQRNQIVRLKDNQGIWKDNPKDIAGIVKHYFQDLYRKPHLRELDDWVGLIDRSIFAECNTSLLRNITREEVQRSNFQMGPWRHQDLMAFRDCFTRTIGILLETMCLMRCRISFMMGFFWRKLIKPMSFLFQKYPTLNRWTISNPLTCVVSFTRSSLKWWPINSNPSWMTYFPNNSQPSF